MPTHWDLLRRGIVCVVMFRALAARPASADQTVFSNETGTQSLGGYAVGLYPPDFVGQPNRVFNIGFNFVVPIGPDVTFNSGSFLAGLDSAMSGGSNHDITLQLHNEDALRPNTPGIAIDTISLNNVLQDAPAIIPFTSSSHPILSAGRQYWLTASMNDSAATSLWYTPGTPDNGLDAASLNGAPYDVQTLPRGAFSISGQATQWQVHFAGSQTLTGHDMNNSVLVYESFGAQGNVLNKFVEPLGSFAAGQTAAYNFLQALKVDAASAKFNIFGTYGSPGGDHGVIVGTGKAFGDAAISSSLNFSDVFSGISEEQLYNDLVGGDTAAVQAFYDSQLAQNGAIASGGLAVTLDGPDYQGLLSQSGAIASGGLSFVDAPPTELVAFSTATLAGQGALELSTIVPEPATLWLAVAGILTMCCRRRTTVS